MFWAGRAEALPACEPPHAPRLSAAQASSKVSSERRTCRSMSNSLARALGTAPVQLSYSFNRLPEQLGARLLLSPLHTTICLHAPTDSAHRRSPPQDKG